MKPPPFAYSAPTTVAEAVTLLAREPNARLIAGGQSLMPILNFRLASPDRLIDLNRIGELAYIREDGGEIAIGAMTRQRAVEFSELVARKLPLFSEAILWVGHRQTRNRGTVGGSLCHLDPSAEIPLIAAVYDATLRTISPRGERRVAIAEFARDIMTTALEPDEILREVRLAPWPTGHGHGFVEFARRHGDFAVAAAAVLLSLDRTGKIERIALALGGVTATPRRLVDVERALVGRSLDAAAIDEAANAVLKIDAMSDATYPAWYRCKVGATMLRRAIAAAVQRTTRKI
jgi:aerobic carbon-monoxide dehydrogenase medium subunit